MSTAAGDPRAGDLPLADVTVRMAVFGHLFAERTHALDPALIPTADALVDVLKERLPRTTQPLEDAPLFEAAAFVGEWLRGRAPAAWVAEGPYEPHLQVVAPTHAIIYLLPLVSIVRVASTAGYDGLPALLDSIIEDVSEAPEAGTLDTIRVQPRSEQVHVIEWIALNEDMKEAARAALWRRCQACSTMVGEDISLDDEDLPWELLAASAAAKLASHPFRCACGGPPGEVSRFLMLRSAPDGPRFADIHLGGTHTRIACWHVTPDGMVAPLDATSLALSGA